MDPEGNSRGVSNGLKFLLLEIGIVVLIVIAALTVLNYFSIVSLSSLSPSLFSSLPKKTQTTNSVTFPIPPLDASNTILIPVATDNPNVNSTAILYNLNGEIEMIEDQNSVTTITLKQDDPVVPPISLLGNTTVQKQIKTATETKFEPAKLTDLKANQNVAFTAIYDPKTGSWKGYNVVIVNTSQ